MGTAAQRTADTGPRERPVLRLLGAEAAAELGGQVTTVRELGRRREEARRGAFATGLPAFDRLLGGGLPRGALVELVGRSSGGRFSIALAALAAATAAGEAAALVDRGDHLDPESAAHLGVDLERLLWLRPRDVRETLAAAETVLAAGFSLVVVELGLAPLAGGRGAEAGWLRLARAAQTHGAALLVASPYRVSGTAAHTVVAARPAAAVYPPGPPLLAGLAARLELDKARGRRGGDEDTLELRLPGAVDAAQPAAERRPPRRPPVARPPAPARQAFSPRQDAATAAGAPAAGAPASRRPSPALPPSRHRSPLSAAPPAGERSAGAEPLADEAFADPAFADSPFATPFAGRGLGDHPAAG
ncbi:MAG TPA: hypothetical protein VHQ65_14285 [Thermoanaerobaculia bacterium]|nr:hypothetical protein [Thermoanaerobaculia bacterium]